MLPPSEWPIPTKGMGISRRKWLIMWRRSRGWSIHDAKQISVLVVVKKWGVTYDHCPEDAR
jgi:hypothetical protein